MPQRPNELCRVSVTVTPQLYVKDSIRRLDGVSPSIGYRWARKSLEGETPSSHLTKLRCYVFTPTFPGNALKWRV